MFQWVEEFFSEVPKETKKSWDVVKAPLSVDLGVITINVCIYATSLEIVGDFYDQKFCAGEKGKGFRIEMRTVFRNKTILWIMTSEFSSIYITTWKPK